MRFFSKAYRILSREKSNMDKTENYLNTLGFTSKTKYFIWVNLKEFKVNILVGSKNNWRLIKVYNCTIGKKSTPTPTGTYEVGIKGLYFGIERGYKCWYYTQFKGNYLFHSIIYNLDGTVRDGRLGEALSNGCIRLRKIDAKWIYDNVPEGSKVFIN